MNILNSIQKFFIIFIKYPTTNIPRSNSTNQNEGFENGKNEGFEDGKNEGERNIILRLLKNHTFEEVAKLLEIGETELTNILNKVD